MNHIYTTPAFIINSSSYGEAGKFLNLFTKDFGMIGVIAQGIRLDKSKLKYHIQDYSFSIVSIVKGKDIWRLTGAYESEKYIKSNILHIKIFKLLKRLLHGEEKNEKLFEIIETLYKNQLNEQDFEFIEYLIVLRILFILGYIRNNESIEHFLDSNIINKDLIDNVKLLKFDLLKIINQALKESQL